jgi:hypothetical protein
LDLLGVCNTIDVFDNGHLVLAREAARNWELNCIIASKGSIRVVWAEKHAYSYYLRLEIAGVFLFLVKLAQSDFLPPRSFF